MVFNNLASDLARLRGEIATLRDSRHEFLANLREKVSDILTQSATA